MWGAWKQRIGQALERLMDWAAARDLTERMDFATDAEWAMLEQNPARPRLLVWSVTGFFLVALLWAGLAHVDEVTRGDGKVVPYLQNQHIQSLDGGIVAQIMVHEGDRVRRDQLLLKIDNTRAVSSLRENQAQYLSLLAKAARLRALTSGASYVPPEQVMQLAPDIASHELALYTSKRQDLDATVAIARQEFEQRSHELSEAQARQEGAKRAFELTSRELAVTRPLKDSGAVSDVDLLRLDRDVAQARGELGQSTAQIAKLHAAIAEASRKIQEVELAFRNAASVELSDTLSKINSLSEGSIALKDKVRLTEVRAPAAGEVKRLYVNTVGSVVQPGKDIIELVPSEQSLLLETRIAPRDIAFLHPGQRAFVRFSAYDYTVYGGMEAVLQDIGADTVTDDKGNAFYIVKVRTNSRALGSAHLPIIPGMVAQIDIMTGKKSILSYLLKPVLRAKAEAMTER